MKAGISINVTEDRSINSFLFLMPINIGTPPVMNLVGIDTGSTLSWVQCQSCQPHCHEQATKAGQIFDPSRSTTFHRAACNSTECRVVKESLDLQFANCMEKENTCLYSVSYWGMWAYTAGKVVWDKFTIGTNTRFSFMFGCSLDVEYKNYEEAGIVGFGYSGISFFEQVSSQINYKAFSYCLPSNETAIGYMNLGDYRGQGADVLYTPLFRTTSKPTYSLTVEEIVANGQNLGLTPSQIVVDSGSLWTILSSDTFDRLDNVITESMKSLNYRRASSGGTICFESDVDHMSWKGKPLVFSSWSSLPLVEMVFTGVAVTMIFPPQNMFYADSTYGLFMTVMKTTDVGVQILGNRATRSFGTTFDIQGMIFGFRYSAC